MPYCIYCGALIQEGNRFCTTCGKPVAEPEPEPEPEPSPTPDIAPEAQGSEPSEAAYPFNPGPLVNPEAAVDVPEQAADEVPIGPEPEPAPEPVPATDLTQPMPVVKAPARQEPAAPASAAEAPAPKRTNLPLIAVICVLVAVIIALVVIFVIKPFDTAGTTEAAPTKTEQPAKKSSKAKDPQVKGDPNSLDEDDSDDEESDTAEQDVYTQVKGYYDQLDGYDQQVRSCATAFNSTAFSSDYSARNSTSDTAHNLLNELEGKLSGVKNLDVPTSSKNYSSWKNTITLYQDLIHRIQVICDAWNLSLGYSDPSAHKDEIVAPIARDNIEGTNDNKYRLDYEQRYANSAPVEVE